MFCTACGTKNPGDANFCKHCGHKLDRTQRSPITEEQFAIPPSDSERFDTLFALALKRDNEGESQAAIDACVQAVGLRPDSTDAHSLLSSLYEKRGDVEKAVAEREKVLELNPGSIADREKLDQLRGGDRPAAVKVNFTRTVPRTTLFDRHGAAYAAGAFVMLVILLAGGYAVWVHGNVDASNTTRPGQGTTQQYTASVPLAVPNPAAQALFGQQPQANVPNQTAAGNPVVGPAPGQQTGPMMAQAGPPAPPPAPRAGGGGPLAPLESGAAPARIPAPPTSEHGARPVANGARPAGDGDTVHLPSDNGPVATMPREHSSISIVVTPGAGVSTPGASSVASDSRQQRQLGSQLQLAGNYRSAIKAYIKALDGAGDESAYLHQQIALCYQRLDEKDSAVAQYNDAIRGYQDQIAAGRNADVAQRGVRLCQAGIKACQ